MDLYPWLVLVHVLAAFGFALSHGVSAFVSFAVRRERDPERIKALLDLSSTAIGGLYASLLTLLVAGIAAGIMGNWFGRGWIWASLGILIVVAVAMYAMATRYYAEIRSAVGYPPRDKTAAMPAPASREQLATMLDTRRPEAIAVVGLGGLALIVWLMVVKPF
ncbi:MAG TPA: DUF2269 family protein [Candidatus Limnocylindrales bacterium]|nr:DUF2269 family protein [Candidatus Limnocylindrales bacterium]